MIGRKRRVKLYGTLRRLACPGIEGLWQGELPKGTSIKELIVHLGTKPEEVAVASINGAACPFETEIPDNAEVILVTPFGGG
jgi:sulfur carrier protein ThiS